MKPIYLYVDDERFPKDTKWTIIRTASLAKRFISQYYLDIEAISLDHDLGDDEDGSGYDVACKIEELAHHWGKAPSVLNCHSANPAGRKNIELAFKAIRRLTNARKPV